MLVAFFVSYFILNYVDRGTVINVCEHVGVRAHVCVCGGGGVKFIMHGNVFVSNSVFSVCLKDMGSYDGKTLSSDVFSMCIFFNRHVFCDTPNNII